jgi:type I restriction-modification system DNA methylase subunit
VRFKNHGVAPRSAADFAFLLHEFHYLKDEGVMAIILPHGVLFRGGAEERIRTKLLKDGHIDTVFGLPANLFYSTGIRCAFSCSSAARSRMTCSSSTLPARRNSRRASGRTT